MSRLKATPVRSSDLPAPVGPYSPGVVFDRLIFVSGQGATDPATGQLAGEDVTAQTEQCLANVRTILRAAGSDLDQVIRCGVFLLDMNDFAEMNAAYERVFGSHRPARTTIQAAGLPGKGLRVEIDCIAYTPGSSGSSGVAGSSGSATGSSGSATGSAGPAEGSAGPRT